MAAVLYALDFRLVYSECDPAGTAYPATYHLWMERTQTEWLFEQGARADRMAARWGISLVTRASDFTYHRAAYLHDALRCEMRLDHLGTTSFRMRFDFVDRTEGLVVCQGRFTLVAASDGKKAPVPDALRQLLLSGGQPG